MGLVVTTELEDLARPEGATSTTLLAPYETTAEALRAPDSVPAGTLGWIQMGRDTSLEQKILANIRDRLGAFATPAPVPAVAPYHGPSR